MERKRMLYKSKVEYMSGEGVYTMNHIIGCSHGCLYDAATERKSIKKSRETALKRPSEKSERKSLFERGKHGVETAARILEK